MQPKDAIDVAFKYADMATRTLQFFLIASVSIVGWVVASDQIRMSDPFSHPRLAWAALYLCIGTLSWLVQFNIMQRVDACFRMAQHFAEDSLKNDPSFLVAVKTPPRFGSKFGLPLLIFLVEVIILGFGDSGLFQWPSPS